MSGRLNSSRSYRTSLGPNGVQSWAGAERRLAIAASATAVTRHSFKRANSMVGFHSFCDAGPGAAPPTWKVRAFCVTVVSVLPLTAVEELRQTLREIRVMTPEMRDTRQNGMNRSHRSERCRPRLHV